MKTKTAPKIIIVRAPGTNCDVETAWAFEQAGGQPVVLHLARLDENPKLLDDAQVLCIPGGFSFGDDIASGKVFASAFRHRLGDAVRQFKSRDRLILGICNGFQTLIKSGLLLDEDSSGPQATLTWNRSGMYRDCWADLTVQHESTCESTRCVFLRGVHELTLPVAHAEGRFVARSPETLAQLEAAGCLVLRYRGESHNGSEGNVAGVCDTTGRVFGLMPHPERFIDPTQHPRWTRTRIDHGDGLAIFRNAVSYFA